MTTAFTVALALAALIAAPGANSAVITYDYTATVTSMFEFDGISSKITNVSASSFSGRTMANGNTLHGRFTYDTSTPLSSYQPSEQPPGGVYLIYGGAGANGMSAKFDQDGYRFAGDPGPFGAHIQVANRLPGQGFDVFYMSMNDGRGALGFETMTLSLFDSTGTAFGVGSLPLSLTLADFAYANIDYGWLRRSDGSQVHAGATLTSLRLAASEVPEPGISMLICVGLLALGGAKARRSMRRSAPACRLPIR